MKTIQFTVEKTSDGFSAYREEHGNNLIATMGADLKDLKSNIVEAYNLYQSESPKNQISEGQINLQFDLPSFFEFYNEINASALGKRIGMHKSLISEYANGKRKPSDKQVKKILTGIRELGRELTELDIV
jgi:hypothetical protein